MRQHSDKGSTQDPTASLLSAACHNYELFSIILCIYAGSLVLCLCVSAAWGQSVH